MLHGNFPRRVAEPFIKHCLSIFSTTGQSRIPRFYPYIIFAFILPGLILHDQYTFPDKQSDIGPWVPCEDTWQNASGCFLYIKTMWYNRSDTHDNLLLIVLLHVQGTRLHPSVEDCTNSRCCTTMLSYQPTLTLFYVINLPDDCVTNIWKKSDEMTNYDFEARRAQSTASLTFIHRLEHAIKWRRIYKRSIW